MMLFYRVCFATIRASADTIKKPADRIRVSAGAIRKPADSLIVSAEAIRKKKVQENLGRVGLVGPV